MFFCENYALQRGTVCLLVHIQARLSDARSCFLAPVSLLNA